MRERVPAAAVWRLTLLALLPLRPAVILLQVEGDPVVWRPAIVLALQPDAGFDHPAHCLFGIARQTAEEMDEHPPHLNKIACRPAFHSRHRKSIGYRCAKYAACCVVPMQSFSGSAQATLARPSPKDEAVNLPMREN